MTNPLTGLSRHSRAALWSYVVLAIGNLVAVAVHSSVVEWLTKPLLMPALLWLIWREVDSSRRTIRLLTAALAAATIADIALLVPGTAAFLIGMACFAVMHLCYITAFVQLGAIRRLGAAGRFSAASAWPAALLVLWAGLNVALWPRLGELAAAVAVYSLILTLMAAAALSLSAVTGIGGLLFMASDLLIGLKVAGSGFAGNDVAIMAGYIAAQLLLVTGWLRVSGTARSSPVLAGGKTRS
jgi:uncharacterized membrane protein YhhN